jgi:hypothetical protein
VCGTTDGDAGNDASDVTPPTSSPNGFFIATRTGMEAAATASGAGHYRYIALQDSMYTSVPGIRAANPSAKIIVMQFVGGMWPPDPHPLSGVVSDEVGVHEEWYLHNDSTGARLYYDGSGATIPAANIGEDSYRFRWLNNVRSRAQADGFDGVHLVGANMRPGYSLGDGGTPIREYRTDDAYAQAMIDFVHYVAPALHAAGLFVIADFGIDAWDVPGRMHAFQALPYVDGYEEQFWMRWDTPTDSFSDTSWQAMRQLMVDAQSAHKPLLANTYGPGPAGAAADQRYARASFLLAWDGRSDSAWGFRPTDTSDPYSNDWGPGVGTPTADAIAVGGGWLRSYSRGVVIVNPSTGTSQSFDLGGSFHDPTGAMVSSVMLAPRSGMTLWR